MGKDAGSYLSVLVIPTTFLPAGLGQNILATLLATAVILAGMTFSSGNICKDLKSILCYGCFVYEKSRFLVLIVFQVQVLKSL